ncbi:MAG: radical SAM protein [archaeon]
MRKIKKTNYYSWLIGKMPDGCKQCVKGQKEVIFLTGVCPRKCFYCPIAENKSQKDNVYANEWKIDNLKDLVTEAKLCSSKGAGVTGGDPLTRLDRTIKVIKLLKKSFGKQFHIHLYTSLNLVNDKVISKLEKEGLDEIRFHPDLDKPSEWKKLLVKTKMSKGVEIPVIPGKKKQTLELIKFIDGKVEFLNLNELEMSDSPVNKIYEHGLLTKNQYSYAIEGSEKLAKELLKFCAKNTKLNVHYCSSSLKNKIQLPERVKRRAKNVKQPFDKLNKIGTLIRGAIYLPELVPSFSYQKILQKANKKKYLAILNKIRNTLIKKIPEKMIVVDENKLRLLTSIKIIKKMKKELKDNNLVPAIVEEMATQDQFEIEVDEL